MHPDANVERRLWHVSDLKRLGGLPQSERHVGNMRGVQVPVLLRDAAHAHVRVADGLNLRNNLDLFYVS